MNVRCDREALLSALSLAAKITKGRTPKPALQCLKLSAQGKHLTVEATDLENAVSIRDASVEVNEPGVSCIPAERLVHAVSHLPDDQVVLRSDGEALVVAGKDGKAKLYGFDPRDFPPSAKLGETTVMLKAGELRRLLELTVFAASTEITRYAMNGVLFALVRGKLMLTATDGKTIAERGVLVPALPAVAFARCITSLKFAGTLLSLLVDDDADVELSLGTNESGVRCGGTTLVSRLVEGDYPEYGEVFPKETDGMIVVNARALRASIAACCGTVAIESRRVTITPGEGRIGLKSFAPEHGETETSVAAEITGKPSSFAISPDYLSDAAGRAADGEAVRLGTWRSEKVTVSLASEPDWRCLIACLLMRSEA